MSIRSVPAERFVDKLDRSGECWLWTGAIDPTGYGRFSVGGQMLYAHRFAFEAFVGEPIPDGYDIDHLCRVRHCVRPSHLEPVTRRENLLRGDTLAAAHAEGRDCGHAACVSCRHKRGAA